MTWGLVQTGMLIGLAALAIPIVIHLMFRQNPREMPIGSIRFLQQIMERHRNRRRIMRWLLMALRLMGIALLALMFARPFRIETTEGRVGERLVAILIDRSASMQSRSEGVRLIDSAVEEARKLIRNADSTTQFEVAFFDHAVEPLTAIDRQTTRDALVQQIVAPGDTYFSTDYAAAFRWARDVCKIAKTKAREVHLFTDLQRSGLAWSDVEPMPADVVTMVHDLGHNLPNNVAVIAASPKRLVVRPGEPTTVFVSLLNAGPFALEETAVVLNLRNGNRTITQQDKIKLEPGSIEQIEFTIPNLDEGLWQGQVTIETIDDLPFDNQRHLAIMSAPHDRILVIDGEPNELDFLSETYHLLLAIRLAPKDQVYAESPYVAVRHDAEADGVPLSGFRIVVMANVARVTEEDATRLKGFVENGGGLLFFTGELVDGSGYEALARSGLMPGQIVANRNSHDLPWRIEDWIEADSIFTPFNDPQHGDLRQLAFRTITEMEPGHGAEVVATFGDGKPFVLEKRIGTAGGTVLCVTTACDNQWSDWTQSELYVPIVHQLLAHLTGVHAGGPIQEELINTASELLTSTVPGIFGRNKSWCIVNVNPRESETERCTVDDLVTRFALHLEERTASPSRSVALEVAPAVQRTEVWHWFLFALVAVAATEYFLSNRTAA